MMNLQANYLYCQILMASSLTDVLYKTLTHALLLMSVTSNGISLKGSRQIFKDCKWMFTYNMHIQC